MRLAIDANVLVSEALRERGRELLQNPELNLVIAAEALGEAEYEIQRRVDVMTMRGVITPEQAPRSLDLALGAVSGAVTTVSSGGYVSFLNEARKRIPRDPGDAPTVALALVLGCGIWTNDYDFFGCGVATWTTETILLQLSGTPRV
jgi:predicted nucleic acid-binding protein